MLAPRPQREGEQEMDRQHPHVSLGTSCQPSTAHSCLPLKQGARSTVISAPVSCTPARSPAGEHCCWGEAIGRVAHQGAGSTFSLEAMNKRPRGERGASVGPSPNTQTARRDKGRGTGPAPAAGRDPGTPSRLHPDLCDPHAGPSEMHRAFCPPARRVRC